MPSDNEFSDEKIHKMLEESRVKQVPPQVLKGFKDDVLAQIAREAGAKTPGRSAPGPGAGSWFAAAFRLPRVRMTVGAGAFACLMLAVTATLVTDRSPQVMPDPALMSARTFSAAAPVSARSSDMMKPAALPGVRTPAGPAVLTVEEELRLIEEFDNKRFFIRQDITLDELAFA